MIKSGRFALPALALASLTTVRASATTICETEVPSGTGSTSPHRGQAMTICAATNAGKASGSVVKTSGSNTDSSGAYAMSVKWLAGSNNAKMHIVDAIVGNIVVDTASGSPCTVTDTTIDSSSSPGFQCNTSLTQQLYMYVITS